MKYEKVDLERNGTERIYSRRDAYLVITIGMIIFISHTLILYCIALKIFNDTMPLTEQE